MEEEVAYTPNEWGDDDDKLEKFIILVIMLSMYVIGLMTGILLAVGAWTGLMLVTVAGFMVAVIVSWVYGPFWG